MDWYLIKACFIEVSGISRDAAHILIGVALQLLLVFFLRRSVADWIPWIIVLIAMAANEAFDLWWDVWPEGERERQWAESAKDFLTTMAIPSLLLILSRYAPARLVTPPVSDRTGSS